jgi:hypothetical protein
MPEPNLPPLYLHDSQSAAQPTQTNVTNIDEEIRKMPPLPRDIRTKLLNDFNISLRNVYVLVVSFLCSVGLIFTNRVGSWNTNQFLSHLLADFSKICTVVMDASMMCM